MGKTTVQTEAKTYIQTINVLIMIRKEFNLETPNYSQRVKLVPMYTNAHSYLRRITPPIHVAKFLPPQVSR